LPNKNESATIAKPKNFRELNVSESTELAVSMYARRPLTFTTKGILFAPKEEEERGANWRSTHVHSMLAGRHRRSVKTTAVCRVGWGERTAS
jgi:hypothetical protein